MLSGLRSPSLKDCFWIGGARGSHPYLAGAQLALVNRQKKKPNDCGSKPMWQQPLYIVLKRDGTYRAGAAAGRTTAWLFTLTRAEYIGEISFEIEMLRS